MDIRFQPLPLDPAVVDAAMPPAMRLALEASFGSVERWRCAFVAMAKAPGAEAGRAMLNFKLRDGTLVNQWAADGSPSPEGAVPLLELDMDEHSHPIDWAPVYQRYQSAVHEASEPWGATPDELPGTQVLDVRRAGMYEKAETRIPGAQWRDPVEVGSWAAELAADREIVVYCVYGHEVGRATAMRLRARGLRARFLVGGIDGWQQAGRPLEPKRPRSESEPSTGVEPP